MEITVANFVSISPGPAPLSSTRASSTTMDRSSLTISLNSFLSTWIRGSWNKDGSPSSRLKKPRAPEAATLLRRKTYAFLDPSTCSWALLFVPMVDTPLWIRMTLLLHKVPQKTKRKSNDIMTTKQQSMSFTGWRFISALRVVWIPFYKPMLLEPNIVYPSIVGVTRSTRCPLFLPC